MTEYIELQSAHMSQHSSNGVKTPWSILTNGDEQKLGEFPNTVSDELMFKIMNFAKKYELKAFNAGIDFQKDKQNEFLNSRIDQLKDVNTALAMENERLASILEKHIGE